MNPVLSFKKAIAICAAVLLALSFTSWKEGITNPGKNSLDTVPVPREKAIKDLDKALEALDAAQQNLEKTFENTDWKKMELELQEAAKHLDVELKEMNAGLKKTLQEIDVEKIKADAEASVAKIDLNKIKAELERVKDADLNINMDKMKKELEKIKVDVEKLKPGLEESMLKARESMQKAKTELQEYKAFTDELEHDGYISKKDGYKIEHKEAKLIINGKLQSNAVYNKFRAFLENHKIFTIENNKEDFKISND